MRTCLLLVMVCSAAVRAEDAGPFAAYDAAIADRLTGMLAVSVAPPRPEPAAPTPEPAPQSPRHPGTALAPALVRLERLRPVLEPILRAEGLPPELLAVVLVESGAHPTALSPKNARGLWQLVPATAQRYGLTVEAARDERGHIVRSTRAAARYLRDLYRQFGNWELALAAYNAGEEAVGRAIRKAGTATFRAVCPLLPAETRRYVPAVIAAMELVGGAPTAAPHRTVVYATTAD